MKATVENLYKNANYSYAELAMLIGYGFIIGFLFSFNKWGVNGIYNRAIGTQNFILYSIISILVIFIFTYIQKVVAVIVGAQTSHGLSWAFVLVSVVLCFVTAGKIIFFIPPTLFIKTDERHLIGRKPVGLSLKNLRVFALLPILVLTLVAVFFSQVLPFSHQVASAFYWVCFFTALYSLIPVEFIVNIPLLFAKEKAEVILSEHVTDKVETRGVSLGSLLFYGNMLNFFFALCFLLSSLISLAMTGFWFTILFACLVTFFATAVYFVNVEL